MVNNTPSISNMLAENTLRGDVYNTKLSLEKFYTFTKRTMHWFPFLVSFVVVVRCWIWIWINSKWKSSIIYIYIYNIFVFNFVKLLLCHLISLLFLSIFNFSNNVRYEEILRILSYKSNYFNSSSFSLYSFVLLPTLPLLVLALLLPIINPLPYRLSIYIFVYIFL